MRNALALLAALAVSAAHADTAVGINSAGRVYNINDVTHAQTFVFDTGLTNTFTLAYNRVDQHFYTISGGNLYRFQMGQAPQLRRSLPFLNGFAVLAIDWAGVCWVADASNESLWRCGTVSGQTLVGTLPPSMGALHFNLDGSLYGFRLTSDSNAFGLYVINKDTAAATRITTGSVPVVDIGGAAVRGAQPGSLEIVRSYFNSGTQTNAVTGVTTEVGGTTSSIQGLAYASDPPFASVATLGTVSLGRIDSNPQGCLVDRDRIPLRMCKFIVPNNTVPPINFQLNGSAIDAAPSTLGFIYTHRAAQAGSFSFQLFVKNQTTALYESVRGSALSTNYVTVHSAIANPTDYVDTNRRINVKMEVRQTGPSATLNWCYELDQFVFQTKA